LTKIRFECTVHTLANQPVSVVWFTMSNTPPLSLTELEERIAISRDNIRQLMEQATAYSGAADEDRNADRLAEQNKELAELLKERDALLKKST
jgi:hypothetical protein